MKRKHSKRSPARQSERFVATRSLVLDRDLRRPPGVPTGWLRGTYVTPRTKLRAQTLAFFRDRKGSLVEKASEHEATLLLRPLGERSPLTTDLPARVVSPAAIARSLGWTAPGKGETATLHALTSAFASVFTGFGAVRTNATWISLRVEPQVTRFAIHSAENGTLLVFATLPTSAGLLIPGISGWGFWMKVLLLLVALAALGTVGVLLFNGGPITWAIFTAAALKLQFLLVFAALEILFIVLDLLLELYCALFPNLTAKIQALRGKVLQAQTLKQSLTAKKAAGQPATKDDWTEVNDLFGDAMGATDQLEQEIDAALPGTTGDRRKELQAGKSACGRMRQALRDARRFIEELKR
jgi:hypothetical protein